MMMLLEERRQAGGRFALSIADAAGVRWFALSIADVAAGAGRFALSIAAAGEETSGRREFRFEYC